MRSITARLLIGAASVIPVAMLACDDPSTSTTHESDILNGTSSNRPDVVMFTSPSKKPVCSGTLIAPDVVLTAAHCIDDIDRAYFGYSLAGAGKIDPDAAAAARSYGIREMVAMPGWEEQGCPMIGVDLALVRLDQAVFDVKPATLSDRMPEVGEECVVHGYGRHKTDEDLAIEESDWTDYTNGEQRQARVRIQPQATDAGSDADADADASDARLPAGETFAAKGLDGAHTKGDSGGPLFCAGQITGVVSCTPNRDLPVLELVKVYASVTAARAFIDSTIASWNEAPDAGDAGNDAAGDGN